MKKLKDSGSISDSEHLNFNSSSELESENNILVDFSGLKTPFKTTQSQTHDTEVMLGSPKLLAASSLNHDKSYYDDRSNETIFDLILAKSSLPKILVSIAGMLLTGYFLNIIIVIKFHVYNSDNCFRDGRYLQMFQNYLQLFR